MLSSGSTSEEWDWVGYEPGPELSRTPWPNDPVMRPFLKVRLQSPNGTVLAVKLLVDSGSEYTLVNWAFARLLGLDLSGAVTDTVAIGGSTYQVSLASLKLRVRKFSVYPSLVGFIRHFDTTHAGIIGQRGCFDHFRVLFDRPNMRFGLALPR